MAEVVVPFPTPLITPPMTMINLVDTLTLPVATAKAVPSPLHTLLHTSLHSSPNLKYGRVLFKSDYDNRMLFIPNL